MIGFLTDPFSWLGREDSLLEALLLKCVCMDSFLQNMVRKWQCKVTVLEYGSHLRVPETFRINVLSWVLRGEKFQVIFSISPLWSPGKRNFLQLCVVMLEGRDTALHACVCCDLLCGGPATDLPSRWVLWEHLAGLSVCVWRGYSLQKDRGENWRK